MKKKKVIKSEPIDEISSILKQLYWEKLNEEGITKEDIELVDLDIAFSPVTPFKGSAPCEVVKTIGGKYQVIHPLIRHAVYPEELKVMRFRYLQFDPERIRQRDWVSNLFKLKEE